MAKCHPVNEEPSALNNVQIPTAVDRIARKVSRRLYKQLQKSNRGEFVFVSYGHAVLHDADNLDLIQDIVKAKLIAAGLESDSFRIDVYPPCQMNWYDNNFGMDQMPPAVFDVTMTILFWPIILPCWIYKCCTLTRADFRGIL